MISDLMLRYWQEQQAEVLRQAAPQVHRLRNQARTTTLFFAELRRAGVLPYGTVTAADLGYIYSQRPALFSSLRIACERGSNLFSRDAVYGVRAFASPASIEKRRPRQDSPNDFRCDIRADEVELYLYGDIGSVDGSGTDGITAAQVATALRRSSPKPITLRINSSGGSVFEGLAIFNQLDRYPGRVHAEIDGAAMSIAATIAMGANTINMGRGSMMMIHKSDGFTVGVAEDMRKMADTLEGIDEQLAGIFADRTGQPIERVVELMENTTYISAEDCVSWGFADSLQ
jgi:ATP-dependent Clp protease protease subunit